MFLYAQANQYFKVWPMDSSKPGWKGGLVLLQCPEFYRRQEMMFLYGNISVF